MGNKQFGDIEIARGMSSLKTSSYVMCPFTNSRKVLPVKNLSISSYTLILAFGEKTHGKWIKDNTYGF